MNTNGPEGLVPFPLEPASSEQAETAANNMRQQVVDIVEEILVNKTRPKFDTLGFGKNITTLMSRMDDETTERVGDFMEDLRKK